MAKNRNITKEKAEEIISSLLPIIWIGVTFLLSSQKGESSSAMSAELARMIRDTLELPMMVKDVNHILRMSAHIFMFGTEGILLMNALKKYKYRMLFSISACTAISVIDEAHKIMIPGRHCHPNEIVLNIISAVITILISGMVLYVLQEVKRPIRLKERI